MKNLAHFCTGYGAHDTHALTLSDGRTNPHPSAGTPYGTIGFDQLDDMIVAPPSVAKDQAQWAIASSYCAPDARSHAAQRDHGSFWALVADIDGGNPSLDQLAGELAAMLGPVCIRIYSSRSATPDNQKWRVLVELAEPITGAEYAACQASFFDGLVKAELQPDHSLERTGQVFYLPNRGEFYEQRIIEGDRLDVRGHPLWQRAQQYIEIYAEQQQAATSTAGCDGPRSHIAAFRRKHSIEEMLDAIGCKCDPRNDDLWRYHAQSSPGFGGIRIMRYPDGDRWVSLSETFNTLAIGRASQSGGRCGDAYDLAAHLSGSAAIEKYARQCLAKEDAARFGTATVAHGEAILEQWRQENPLPAAGTISPRSKFSTMPEPKGPILEVAGWLYSKVMNDPQRDLAILGAWLLVASFAGRKDSLKNNPPVVQVRLMAITGTGKDSIRKAREMILQGLRDRSAAKGEIGHAAMLGISSLETLAPAFGTGRMAKDMLATLSSLCIVPEAGIARRSKAGDVDSVRAAMMQNFAQDAYSRASLKGLAERIPSPYGVNISLLEETTKETLLTTDGQVSSGETARKLSFQIDASDVGDAVLHDAAPVPDHILDIFDKLATEALRDEDPTQMHGEGKSAIPATSISPVPTDRRVIYQLDGEAQAEMAKMLEERTAFKQANKDNTPNLEWAQRGRYEQLVLRLALVHARTGRICGPSPFAAPVVRLADLDAARALVDESRRTEKANSDDFDTPMDRLVGAMHDFALSELGRDEPSGTYKSKLGAGYSEHFKQRRLNSQMFTGAGAQRKHAIQSKSLVEQGFYKTIADAMRAAAREGAQQGLWEIDSDEQKGRWAISGVQSR